VSEFKDQNQENGQARADANDPTGRVRFDDRGNAVWETWRGKRLEHPGLALTDDGAPPPYGGAPINAKAGRIGYNPYESGQIKRKPNEVPKKKDLRALSQWIQQKKALESKA